MNKDLFDLIQTSTYVCNYYNKYQNSVFLEVLNNSKEVANVYSRFNGDKRFLYVADKDEIETSINTNAVYLGTKDKEGKIMGVVKIGKLSKVEPFFVPPKNENQEGDYFGESGLFVDIGFRGQNIAKILTANAVTIAKSLGASGIYADCDYRNVCSSKVLVNYYNLIGCTDGTNGSEVEDSTYLTFFKSFDNPPIFRQEITLDMSGKSAQEARDEVVTKLKEVDEVTSTQVPYGSGYNQVYVSANVNEFQTFNLIQDPVL